MKRNKKYKEIGVIAEELQPPFRFQVLEAYKTARTNLSFSIVKDGCKKIVVTSPLQKEGKTTNSVNIALTLAEQLNTKVLLMDCDLRNPKVDKFFSSSCLFGLSDYLTNDKPLEDIICDTDKDSLKVIFSGPTPPNPSEILADTQMKNLLDALEKDFDYVIMDTPPLNIVIDSLPIVKISDGVVISVVQSESKHGAIEKILYTLKSIDAKVLGFILIGDKKPNRRFILN